MSKLLFIFMAMMIVVLLALEAFQIKQYEIMKEGTDALAEENRELVNALVVYITRVDVESYRVELLARRTERMRESATYRGVGGP